MEKIELYIIALSHSIAQSNSYAVVLGEKNGTRRLPIVIGAYEAQAIAIAIENIEPTRPLTHDLMRNMIDILEVKLVEVNIVNIVSGVFYAQLVCEHGGQVHEIDSRTSDAIALAARLKCPIFTNEEVLSAAGVKLNEDELRLEQEGHEEQATEAHRPDSELTTKSMEELQHLLKDAIDHENYEGAARIRDEIAKRSTN